MKKRFSPKQLLPSKKVIMAIAAAACVTAFSIGGVHYYNTNLKETATTATYYNQYLAASGADEVITDQVKDYISNYFQTMNVNNYSNGCWNWSGCILYRKAEPGDNLCKLHKLCIGNIYR